MQDTPLALGCRLHDFSSFHGCHPSQPLLPALWSPNVFLSILIMLMLITDQLFLRPLPVPLSDHLVKGSLVSQAFQEEVELLVHLFFGITSSGSRSEGMMRIKGKS